PDPVRGGQSTGRRGPGQGPQADPAGSASAPSSSGDAHAREAPLADPDAVGAARQAERRVLDDGVVERDGALRDEAPPLAAARDEPERDERLEEPALTRGPRRELLLGQVVGGLAARRAPQAPPRAARPPPAAGAPA